MRLTWRLASPLPVRRVLFLHSRSPCSCCSQVSFFALSATSLLLFLNLRVEYLKGKSKRSCFHFLHLPIFISPPHPLSPFQWGNARPCSQSTINITVLSCGSHALMKLLAWNPIPRNHNFHLLIPPSFHPYILSCYFLQEMAIQDGSHVNNILTGFRVLR